MQFTVTCLQNCHDDNILVITFSDEMASVNNALVLVLRRKVLAVKKGLIWYSSKGIKTFLPLHFCISNTSTPKHLHTSYLLPPPADTFHALAILLIPKTPAKMKTMDKQWLWKKKKKKGKWIWKNEHKETILRSTHHLSHFSGSSLSAHLHPVVNQVWIPSPIISNQM